MVKNKKGGSGHKKMARKHVDQEDENRKYIRTRDPEENCEMYAVVTKMYGHGNVEVYCQDGTSRLCVIRKKFRGRFKSSNRVSSGSIILVGLRDWESCAKEKCDLLEVYSRNDMHKLEKDKFFDKKALSVGLSSSQGIGSGGIGGDLSALNEFVDDDIVFARGSNDEDNEDENEDDDEDDTIMYNMKTLRANNVVVSSQNNSGVSHRKSKSTTKSTTFGLTDTGEIDFDAI